MNEKITYHRSITSTDIQALLEPEIPSLHSTYVATAASAYGPEYYWALLAEPEDDIPKPKRTLATQKVSRLHESTGESLYCHQ